MATDSSPAVDPTKQRWLVAGIAIALYVGWLVVYVCSLDLHGRNFDYENFIFDADGPRVVMVATVLGATWSTDRHPLYVVMLQPIGLALNALLGDAITATECLTAALAALGIPAAFAVLRRTTRSLVDGALWTMLYAGSSTVWLFAAQPETFAINAATIAIGYVLQLTPEPNGNDERPPTAQFRRKLVIHILFAVIATGLTLTNSVYALISFCSLAWKHRPQEKPKRWFVVRLAVFLVSVTLLLGVLSRLESRGYHNTHEFTGAQDYTDVVKGDQQFVIIDDELAWLVTEARTLFGDSIVAPRASMQQVMQVNSRMHKKPGRWQILQFNSSPGWMFWASCGFALAFFVALAVRRDQVATVRTWRSEMWMAIAAIAFNAMLHSFYRGIGEPLMYGTHVVFPILLLLSLLYARSALPHKRALLAGLVICIIATNAVFLGDVNDGLRNDAPKPFRAPPAGRVVNVGSGAKH